MKIPDLRKIPNFCGHEHWGSIASIGMAPEGFRADVVCGAVPTRPTGVADLVIDPYLRGMLNAAGSNPDAQAREAGAKDFFSWVAEEPDEALPALDGMLQAQRLTGTFQCVRRGILALYDIDIDEWEPNAIRTANAAIQKCYARMFAWYREAIAQAHFTELVRIVHPEYYVREESPERAAEERAFTHTIMRVDPLLDLWRVESSRRDGLTTITGIDPVDAESWRAFVAAIFALAERAGACGIKQLQAYRRPLLYTKREDSEVVWRGDLDADQVRAFQDWVMHACCAEADRRGWVHQIHVGTHNLEQSSPMPLRELANAYPNMKIVMLHCWPFLQECGWLAKFVPNIHIDTCWQPILNPEFYREALRLWLNYVPSTKITCAHDATSVEMAVGSSLFTREILSESLAACSASLGTNRKELERIALELLHNNSVHIYGRGTALSD